MRGALRVAALAAAALCAAAAQAQFSMAELFAGGAITNSLGETMPVRVWRHYEKKDLPVPVVVLLHGSGECGRDNAKQLSNFGALNNILLLDDELPPALWAIPQCTPANPWVRSIAFKPDYRQPRYPSPALRTVKEWVDGLIAEGVADPDRIYVAGLSLGGFGTWDAIQRWPNYFAAAVPVCGGGSIQEEAIRNAATTPVWVFHGEADANVPVDCSRRMVSALTRAGAAPKQPPRPPPRGAPAAPPPPPRPRRGAPPHAPAPNHDPGGFLGSLLEYVTPDCRAGGADEKTGRGHAAAPRFRIGSAVRVRRWRRRSGRRCTCSNPCCGVCRRPPRRR